MPKSHKEIWISVVVGFDNNLREVRQETVLVLFKLSQFLLQNTKELKCNVQHGLVQKKCVRSNIFGEKEHVRWRNLISSILSNDIMETSILQHLYDSTNKQD